MSVATSHLLTPGGQDPQFHIIMLGVQGNTGTIFRRTITLLEKIGS